MVQVQLQVEMEEMRKMPLSTYGRADEERPWRDCSNKTYTLSS